MTNIFRTMILPASVVEDARTIAATLAPTGGAGMFTTGLSASGVAPTTHYVSSGLIDEAFASLIVDADALYAALVVANPDTDLDLDHCLMLVEQAEVSDGTTTDAEGNTVEEGPFQLFERLGLKLVSTPE